MNSMQNNDFQSHIQSQLDDLRTHLNSAGSILLSPNESQASGQSTDDVKRTINGKKIIKYDPDKRRPSDPKSGINKKTEILQEEQQQLLIMLMRCQQQAHK